MARKKKVVTQPLKPGAKKPANYSEEAKTKMRNPRPARTIRRGSLDEVLSQILSEVKSGTIPAKGPYTVTLTISKKTTATVKRIPKTLTFELE